MSLNKVMVLGRLGADPELKPLKNGGNVCNLSVATNEVFNDRQGVRQERTEWHRVVVFGKLADLCQQYLQKGRQVFVEGRLQTRSWQDNAGATKYTTEIIANTVEFLGSGASAGTNSFAKPSDSVSSDFGGHEAADDIPF